MGQKRHAVIDCSTLELWQLGRLGINSNQNRRMRYICE